jgi:hypothetical protein
LKRGQLVEAPPARAAAHSADAPLPLQQVLHPLHAHRLGKQELAWGWAVEGGGGRWSVTGKRREGWREERREGRETVLAVARALQLRLLRRAAGGWQLGSRGGDRD